MLNPASDIRVFETKPDEVLILTPDFIYTEVLKEQESLFIEAIQYGAELPKHGEVFAIPDILKISCNKKGRLITVVTRLQFRKTSTDFIVMLDPHIQEDFIQHLHIHMGKGYKYTKEELTSSQAAIKPLFIMLIITGLGIFLTSFATIAQQQSIEKGRIVKAQARILYAILSAIGPIGVIVIFGLAFLICLIVLVRRVKNPPVIMRIKHMKPRISLFSYLR
ncbi:hypothetical protein [Paenibacillus fonticola]|uniref:hypothetical protein n=1 Tax=Paenibacillus fonticola TaxID=379896 RepID=UPI000368B415|nr:hypothetical protein [Paenibacillus fonticola]